MTVAVDANMTQNEERESFDARGIRIAELAKAALLDADSSRLTGPSTLHKTHYRTLKEGPPKGHRRAGFRAVGGLWMTDSPPVDGR
jgi:hypothetical protein